MLYPCMLHLELCIRFTIMNEVPLRQIVAARALHTWADAADRHEHINTRACFNILLYLMSFYLYVVV